METRFCTLAEASQELGVSATRLRQLCAQGRVRGAQKHAETWFIPRPFRITMKKKDVHHPTKLKMRAC